MDNVIGAIEQLIENAASLDWGYIMSTLVIRFVGVFVVLGILLAGMLILGKIVSKLVALQEEKKAKQDDAHADEPLTAAMAEVPERKPAEEELVAAIGAAIAFTAEAQRRTAIPVAPAVITAGSWAMAGRVEMMDGRLQGGSQRHPAQNRG